MHNTTEDQEMRNIISRFNRVEGQVRGIQKMISENREAADIITQISAIISATKRAASAFTLHELNDLNTLVAQGDEDAAGATSALINAFVRLD